jgi:beta-glucosidase
VPAPGRPLPIERVELKPGESRRVTLQVDPRLLARFDGKANQWRITGGRHGIAVGKSAADPVLKAETTLNGRLFGR